MTSFHPSKNCLVCILFNTVLFILFLVSASCGESDLCGNARLDEGEYCDTGVASGEWLCPRTSDCDDEDPCTEDQLLGEGCQARCEYASITVAQNDDGCCPAGMNRELDNDCPVECNCDTSDQCEPGCLCDLDCSTSGTWTSKASMPTSRLGLAAAEVNGTLYAIGGSTRDENVFSTVEAYDPFSNNWTTKAPMSTERSRIPSF